MARTIAIVKARIEALKDALDSGTNSVSIDGVTTSFRSVSEINARIRQLTAELQALNSEDVTATPFVNVSLNHAGDL